MPASDTSKELLRQQIYTAEDLLDDLYRKMEENLSIGESEWRKYEEVFDKIFVKLNELKNGTYYI